MTKQRSAGTQTFEYLRRLDPRWSQIIDEPRKIARGMTALKPEPPRPRGRYLHTHRTHVLTMAGRARQAEVLDALQWQRSWGAHLLQFRDNLAARLLYKHRLDHAAALDELHEYDDPERDDESPEADDLRLARADLMVAPLSYGEAFERLCQMAREENDPTRVLRILARGAATNRELQSALWFPKHRVLAALQRLSGAGLIEVVGAAEHKFGEDWNRDVWALTDAGRREVEAS